MFPKKKLSDIADIYNGNSINKAVKQQNYMKEVPGWNYIGTKDVDFDGTVTYKTGVIIPFSEAKFRTAPAGTVFVCSEGGSAGKKTAIIQEEVCFGNKLYAIVNNKGNFIPKYVYYYTRYEEFLKQFKLKASTLMGGITAKNFGMIELPLPSLCEQQRIVSRIEELFSSLDNAVETLQKTKEQLAVYRQAVLKEAFDSVSGNRCSIRDICKELKVGIVIKPTQYYVSNNGVLAFRNANVRRGYIDDCDWVMISKEGHKQNRKSEVHEGDVLISRSGANLGMASPVPKKFDGYNAIDIVIAVPDKAKILPAYLAHYTNSPLGRSIVKKNERGAAQGHLNVSAYGRLPIVVPSLLKQKAIVEEIEGKLSICVSIEQTVNSALTQAEAMRQSILKEAFEGRLV